MMRFLTTISLTAISLLLELASADPNRPFCGLNHSEAIQSTQSLQGDEFIGAAVSANRLHPKFVHEPMSAALHIDNGNTRTVDYPGPLGHDLKVTSIDTHYAQFFWDVRGTTFAAYGGPCNDNASDIAYALAVLDPETLEFETIWQPPKKYAKSQINLTYMQVLMETDEIVLNTQEGQIFILYKRQRANDSPIFRLRRTIDLEPSGVLAGNPLLNTLMDAAGNIWFTTDGLGAAGAATTNMTVVGYVEKDDTVHSMQLLDQAVENGPAVSNTTFFFNVGPAGANDHANASGFVSALQPGPGTSINVVWNATYDAGSGRKPGSFARGSRTTPALLGNDFVALADCIDCQW